MKPHRPIPSAPPALAMPLVEAAPPAASAEAGASAPGFVTASHAILFGHDERLACDVCGLPVSPSDDDEGYDVSGTGLYVWSRGDGGLRIEEPGLCPSCGTAIGMSALLRWSVEEDEG